MRVFDAPPPPNTRLLPLKHIDENLIFKWYSSWRGLHRCIGQHEFLDMCMRIKRMIVRSTFARVVEMIWKLAVGCTLWNASLCHSFFPSCRIYLFCPPPRNRVNVVRMSMLRTKIPQKFPSGNRFLYAGEFCSYFLLEKPRSSLAKGRYSDDWPWMNPSLGVLDVSYSRTELSKRMGAVT